MSPTGYANVSKFQAFIQLYKTLPNLTPILAGKGDRIPWPQEPSTKYATAVGSTVRAADANQAYNAFIWLSQVATAEWVQLFAVDLFRVMRSKRHLGFLAQLVQKDPKLQQFMKDFQQIINI